MRGAGRTVHQGAVRSAHRRGGSVHRANELLEGRVAAERTKLAHAPHEPPPATESEVVSEEPHRLGALPERGGDPRPRRWHLCSAAVPAGSPADVRVSSNVASPFKAGSCMVKPINV
jgi:hypothetical protein